VPLEVTLVSADRQVWSGEASRVIARTVDGDIGILGGQEPLLALLASGEIRITPSSGEDVVATLDGGFMSVEHDRVTVVSDTAALASGSTAPSRRGGGDGGGTAAARRPRHARHRARRPLGRGSRPQARPRPRR